MNDQERLDSLLRHINLVRENCERMAEKLTDRGEYDLARRLLQNSFLHDNSKFNGIEWQFLTDPQETNRSGLKYAVQHHQRVNPHHPEYWTRGIHDMPLVYRYEMIADIAARSTEMATSARDFVVETMPNKYGFVKNGPLHQELMAMLELICSKPFTPIEIIEQSLNEENAKNTDSSK